MNELGVFFSSLGLVVCCMKWINANQHDSWFSIFSAMFNSSCCILFYLIFFLSSLHFLIVFICLVRQPVLSWGSLSLSVQLKPAAIIYLFFSIILHLSNHFYLWFSLTILPHSIHNVLLLMLQLFLLLLPILPRLLLDLLYILTIIK